MPAASLTFSTKRPTYVSVPYLSVPLEVGAEREGSKRFNFKKFEAYWDLK
jgi:hypothetical protein